MNQELKKEIEEIIKKLNLQCSVKDFPSIVDWYRISKYQKLSESFIEKYSDKVDWIYISKYQKLNESFIEKHSDKVIWYCISRDQKLTESFIEKFKDRLDIAKIPKENIIYQKENDIQDNCKRNTCYNCKQPTEVLNTGLRNIMKWCPQCKV